MFTLNINNSFQFSFGLKNRKREREIWSRWCFFWICCAFKAIRILPLPLFGDFSHACHCPKTNVTKASKEGVEWKWNQKIQTSQSNGGGRSDDIFISDFNSTKWGRSRRKKIDFEISVFLSFFSFFSNIIKHSWFLDH